MFNTITVESVVELCENGPRRCLHCNGVSNLACDRVAVTKDCYRQDVSRQTLFCYINLSRLHSPCFIVAVRIDVIRPFVKQTVRDRLAGLLHVRTGVLKCKKMKIYEI